MAPGKAERAAILGQDATNVMDHVAAEERHGVMQPFSVYIEK